MPHRHRAAATPFPLRQLPGIALRATLREGYTRADLRRDALAGVVVGIVALPLSMALAIAVGAPPQHGLYTAIVAGFITAALGGSRTQVSGPTAAFIVILAPIYAKFGLAGLLLSGAMGGVMLILMGLLRLGRFIQFIPHPVTTGFTAGIATVIATLQLKDLFGLKPASNPDQFAERVVAMFAARHTANFVDVAIGALTLGLLLLVPRRTRRIPAPLVALPVAAVVAAVLAHFVPSLHVETIASRFHSIVGGEVVAGIPRLPPMPMLPWRAAGPDGQTFTLSYATFRLLANGAFAIAMLGAIESLLSAVVSDAMAGTKHDPDAELIGLGVANVVAPFFGGIPATGAIARTATNVRSGARSPFAAMVHSATVLVAVLLLAPLVGYLPMSSLAALLLLVAWNMSEVKHFVHIVRVAARSDVAVLLVCFGLTVATDMVVSVTVGVMLAALLFMRRMAEVTGSRLLYGETAGEGLPRKLLPGIVLYDIEGPLFFGAAQRAMGALEVISDDAKVVIMRFDKVPAMDSTGLVAFESAANELKHRSVLAIVTGLRPQPHATLEKAGLRPSEHLRICASIEEALDAAEAHLGPGPPSAQLRAARASEPAPPAL